jgi:hypothetical protein
MRPTRREVSCLVASWLLWAFVALHVQGPWDTILGYNDHWTHVNTTVLFLEHGFDIWNHKKGTFCSPRLPPGYEGFVRDGECYESDVCSRPELPGSRPLCVNWQQQGPQPYPPGLNLYMTPQALLYEHTHLRVRTINVLTMLELLAAAHLLFWALFRLVFRARSHDDLPGGLAWEHGNPWLRWGLFGLIYLEVIKQTMNGFYDAIGVFAVLLGIYLLAKRRPVDALLALSLGLLLHYRALWYAPVLAVAALRSLRSSALLTSKTTALKLAVSALALLAFAHSLFLIYPFLKDWPELNPVLLKNATFWMGKEWDLYLPMGFIFLYLAWGRHWLMLGTMVWQLYIASTTPHTYDWHALFLLPMLGVARLYDKRGVMVAAFLFYLVEASVIYGAIPFPGQLIAAFPEHWGRVSF